MRWNNNIWLSGNLTRDIEEKKVTPDGNEFLCGSIAVYHSKKKSYFFNFTVFKDIPLKKKALLKKGQAIILSGEMAVDNYTSTVTGLTHKNISVTVGKDDVLEAICLNKENKSGEFYRIKEEDGDKA